MRQQKSRVKQPTDTLAEAFCLQALMMMGHIYLDRQSSFNMPTLPNPTEEEIQNSNQKPESKHAFQSRVADLKLRRITNKTHLLQDSFNENLKQQLKDYDEHCNSENVVSTNIDDAFNPPAPKYNSYKYVENMQNVQEPREKKPAKQALDMKKINREYQARLDEAKEKGINRAKRRAERLQRGAPGLYGAASSVASRYYQRSESSRNI